MPLNEHDQQVWNDITGGFQPDRSLIQAERAFLAGSSGGFLARSWARFRMRNLPGKLVSIVAVLGVVCGVIIFFGWLYGLVKDDGPARDTPAPKPAPSYSHQQTPTGTQPSPATVIPGK